jgi:cytochrome bd-type quinol oxidase subunit 1
MLKYFFMLLVFGWMVFMLIPELCHSCANAVAAGAQTSAFFLLAVFSRKI